MHGRGYVKDGDRKAARYIRNELEEYGVDPLFDSSYFQAFEVNVNTFPGSMELVLDGEVQEPGIEFIPDPLSGSTEGTYHVHRITPPMLADRQRFRRVEEFGSRGDRIAVLDPQKARGDSARNFLSLRYALARKGPVIVLNGEDLTWGIRDTAFANAILEVDSNRIDLREDQEVQIDVEGQLERDYRTRNVGGIIPGKNPSAEPILLSGHYDHLGRMGKDTYIPGASDNGSGIAMLLHFAERFAQAPPDRPIVFLFFGAEELGILGSKHYSEEPAFPLEDIEFQFNLDIVGGGSKGIAVVNGKVYQDALDRLRSMNEEANYFPKIKARGKAMNSDHYWFSKAGVPSFFIYTLGDVKAYHDVHDTADNLPMTKFDELVKLLERFVREYDS